VTDLEKRSSQSACYDKKTVIKIYLNRPHYRKSNPSSIILHFLLFYSIIYIYHHKLNNEQFKENTNSLVIKTNYFHFIKLGININYNTNY